MKSILKTSGIWSVIVVVNDFMKIVDSATANPQRQFVCKDCDNTGKLEIIQYTGKNIEGQQKHGDTIVGFNRGWRMCFRYYMIINPNLKENMNDYKQLHDELSKAKSQYPIDIYYKVIGVQDCNSCKTSQWR